MAIMQGHLTLIGQQFDTELVSARLKVHANWEKHPQDALDNGRLFGHAEWGVVTSYYDSDDMNDLIDSLIKLVPVSKEEMRAVAEEMNAKWNILLFVEVKDDFPAIILSETFLHFASSIGAVVGFDVYCLNC